MSCVYSRGAMLLADVEHAGRDAGGRGARLPHPHGEDARAPRVPLGRGPPLPHRRVVRRRQTRESRPPRRPRPNPWSLTSVITRGCFQNSLMVMFTVARHSVRLLLFPNHLIQFLTIKNAKMSTKQQKKPFCVSKTFGNSLVRSVPVLCHGCFLSGGRSSRFWLCIAHMDIRGCSLELWMQLPGSTDAKNEAESIV